MKGDEATFIKFYICDIVLNNMQKFLMDFC